MTDFYYIEKSTLTPLTGTFFLKGAGKYVGHCHTMQSVKQYLASTFFCENNKDLVPIFEKALAMMQQEQSGRIEL